jgi:hypothetical protein
MYHITCQKDASSWYVLHSILKIEAELSSDTLLRIHQPVSLQQDTGLQRSPVRIHPHDIRSKTEMCFLDKNELCIEKYCISTYIKKYACYFWTSVHFGFLFRFWAADTVHRTSLAHTWLLCSLWCCVISWAQLCAGLLCIYIGAFDAFHLVVYNNIG